MYKLSIFCILGFLIVDITAESTDPTTNDDRESEIRALKNYLSITKAEHNLTCENYQDYCETGKVDSIGLIMSSIFHSYCTIGLKGYLCDNKTEGEQFVQLFDEIKAAFRKIQEDYNKNSDEPIDSSAESSILTADDFSDDEEEEDSD